MRRALVGFVVLAVGCAHQGPLLHAPESRHWTELTSRHFVLRTDLTRHEARAALADFEGVYGTLERVAFGGDAPRDRIDVVLFSDEVSFRRLAPPGATGYFMPRQPNDPDPKPTIAIYGRMLIAGTLVDTTERRFRHELTHRFLDHRLRWSPPWLAEGMAEYYSTLKVEGGYATVGILHHEKLLRVDIKTQGSLIEALADNRVDLAKVPTVAQLLAADYATFHDPAHELANYAGAWAFVHMMLNGPYGYAPRFTRFLDLLGGGATVTDAWRESFFGVSMATLEDQFHRYLNKPEMDARVITVQVPKAPRPDAERRMRPDEVHLLLARVRPWDSREGIMAAGEELRQARALAPSGGTPELHYWSGLYAARWRHFGEAARELRAAVAAAPTARNWLALATVLAQDEQAGTAQLDDAVAHLTPLATSAQALNFIARWYWQKGQIQAGLTVARRAVAVEKSCWECADTLAVLQNLQSARPMDDSDMYTKPSIQ